ncbi:MAG: Gfo/Idh/MocA family protein [Planctomycetota bacterium]|jgi:predicted dehydrogenase
MGISIGIVGLGAFGSEFVPLFKGHPLVDRIALCDRESERIRAFAEKDSFKDKFKPGDAYESFDDILKTDLDALVIITQPWLHAEQAVRAMEAGKHVYSAVPVVMLPDGDEILDWCNRIVETSRRTGMRYMLGETTYYRPETMFCRRRAAEGAFGGFVFAEGEYFHDVDLPSCNLRDVQKWRTSSASGREWLEREGQYHERGIGGGPMHYPTHSVSGPLCVMKTHMKKVAAFGFASPKGDEFFEGEPFADETALFQAANGATVRICEYRLVGARGREMFSIYGTDASFLGGEHGYGPSRWMDKSSSRDLSTEDMRDPLPAEVAEAFAKASHAYLVHEFVESVAENRQSVINAWEAVRYMAAGVMAHKSAMKGGELLDVPDWGDAPM